MKWYPIPSSVIQWCMDSGCNTVLLESAAHNRFHRNSYLFQNPRHILTAHNLEEVQPLLKEVDTFSKTTWVAGYLSYEAGYALEECLSSTISIDYTQNHTPLAWFGIFDRPFVFDHQTGSWFTALPDGANSPPASLPPALYPKFKTHTTLSAYRNTIKALHSLIARGHTYQVNFTFDFLLQTTEAPAALYQRLRENQPVPYSCFIQAGNLSVLSFSPELFFKVHGKTITVKPMKGTAPRGRFHEEDTTIARNLAQDEKNRAENIMIVDLMRNDLGKICDTASIHVVRPFQVETHHTVHQMTSTVSGRLKPGTLFSAIVRALFPSGSVTGAPKIRTMEIIHDLEKGNRGVYCGMIGYCAPGGSAVFSVPIRTLQKSTHESHWRYRVGSGIVWDSEAANEWEECRVKCSFLSRRSPRFQLIESLLLRNGRLLYERDHKRRMRYSARFFKRPFSAHEWDRIVEEITRTTVGAAQSISSQAIAKIRILLSEDGTFQWESSPCVPDTFGNLAPVVICTHPVESKNIFLFHKTTHRPWYDREKTPIQRGECWDVLFQNEHGLMTEGIRSNLFIRKKDMLLTPSRGNGLLNGVLRQNLIKRRQCRETDITLSMLLEAREVFCGNSVRGLRRVFVQQG